MRPVLSNLERHTGDKLDGLLAGSVYTFNLKFAQEIYKDKETLDTCQHYPGKLFQTYQDCDKSYIRSES